MDPYSQDCKELLQKADDVGPFERRIRMKRPFEDDLKNDENSRQISEQQNTLPVPKKPVSIAATVGHTYDFEFDNSNFNPHSFSISKQFDHSHTSPLGNERSLSRSNFSFKTSNYSQQQHLYSNALENTSSHPQLFSFIDNEKIIREFESFLLTKGGGGRRLNPVMGDIGSSRCLVNSLGWDHFWNPNALNEYITDSMKEEKYSPSTLYGRLRVYERFIHFIRIQLPVFLPSHTSITAIEAMITNLKESLGKDRHIRNGITMAVSRERMPISLKIIQEWRSRRENVEVKALFRKILNKMYLLNEKDFVKLRNFLIV